MGDGIKKSRNLPGTLNVLSCLAAVFFVLGVCWWGVLRHEWAVRREALRQEHIAKSLVALRHTYPGRVFSPCNTDAAPIAFHTDFYEAGVRSVTLSRSGSGVTVSVGLLGIKQENQAPTIYVTLYDENGAVLSRSPVVDYTFALLAHGDQPKVKDQIKLPKNADPVIVSVDDPKQYKTPWGADG